MKKGDVRRLKYKQPHNIRLVGSGNPALDDRLQEKAPVEGKIKAKLTQKQARIMKRRKHMIELASREELYCESHGRYLCVMDVEERKCYMRHGKPPVCRHLRYENAKGILRPYGR